MRVQEAQGAGDDLGGPLERLLSTLGRTHEADSPIVNFLKVRFVVLTIERLPEKDV